MIDGKRIKTVGGLIDSLKRFPKEHEIIIHAKGTVWDSRIISVKCDLYEKRRNQNVVMIKTT